MTTRSRPAGRRRERPGRDRARRLQSVTADCKDAFAGA